MVNKLILGIMMTVSIFYLSGCFDPETKTSVETHPDAKEVLSLNENANIFAVS